MFLYKVEVEGARDERICFTSKIIQQDKWMKIVMCFFLLEREKKNTNNKIWSLSLFGCFFVLYSKISFVFVGAAYIRLHTLTHRESTRTIQIQNDYGNKKNKNDYEFYFRKQSAYMVTAWKWQTSSGSSSNDDVFFVGFFVGVVLVIIYQNILTSCQKQHNFFRFALMFPAAVRFGIQANRQRLNSTFQQKEKDTHCTYFANNFVDFKTIKSQRFSIFLLFLSLSLSW